MAVSVGQEDEVMSTINITPFTDVLLVLLIIFIILAAVIKEPKLPDARNKDLVAPSQIVVTIDDKNNMTVGSTEIPFGPTQKKALSDALGQLQDQTNHSFKEMIVKANPKSQMGRIIDVMDAARAVGLTSFGLANHIEGQPQPGAQ